MGEQITIESPLIGRHQLRNLALAIATSAELARQGFPVTARSIETGVRNTHWSGRFQVLPVGDSRPQFVFDAAHNPAGAWALRSTLSTLYEGKRLIFVFGVMRDKAMGEITEILFPLAARVILTQADNPRSATPDEIRRSTRVLGDFEETASVQAAIEQAQDLAGMDGTVVITGSIYLVGEAMSQLGIKV
jgi:dihydrofolate synthase / folylpolyglutamate synthase